MCMAAQIDGHKLCSGDIDDDQRQKLLDASHELSDLPVFIDDHPARNTAQIGAISRRLKRHTTGADHHRLSPTHRAGRSPCPPRTANRPDHPPPEADLQGALRSPWRSPSSTGGRVPRGQAAPAGRPSRKRGDRTGRRPGDLPAPPGRVRSRGPPGRGRTDLAKHRNGPTGVYLTWRKEFMRFESYSPVTGPAGGYFPNADL